jgi:hypothetical protein
MVHRAAPVLTEHARSVGVVHHHGRPELLGRLDDARQRRDVAVHAEDAVGGHQDRPIRPPADLDLAAPGGNLDLVLRAGVAQQAPQGFDVLVREDDPRRLAHAHAVDDRGVVERVRDDQVVLAGQDRDDARVGREARLEGQDRLGVLEVGQLGLELLVDRHRAGDRPNRPRACPEIAGGRDRGLLQARVGSQPQVVVGAEVDQLNAVDDDFGRLGGRKHAQRPVQVLALQLLDLIGQKPEGIVGAFGHLGPPSGSIGQPSWGSSTTLPATPWPSRSKASA